MADLKISQLPTFTPPLQNTDLFPASQFIGTPGAQTNKVPWGNILSQIQGSSFPSLSVSGLTGATAGTRYAGATTSGSPVSGSFLKGDFIIDQSGSIWVCTVSGSPGTWNSVGFAPVTSVFGRTGDVAAVNTDYSTVSYFQTKSQKLISDWDGGFSDAPFYIQGATDNNKQLYMGIDTNINAGIIRAVWEGVEDLELKLNPANGSVSVNLTLGTAAQSILDVVGDISLGVITTPGAPRSNTGKIYPKSDNGMYFLNSLNVESSFILSKYTTTQDIAVSSNLVSTLQINGDILQWYQLKVANSSGDQLIMGVDSTTHSGGIFSRTSSGYAPLLLCPIGNNFVGIGSSGNSSSLIFYTPTANRGYLQISSNDASGNFYTQITNASMGQNTTITIPDPAFSSANFILSNSVGSQQSIVNGLSVNGKLSSPSFASTGLTGASQVTRIVGANSSGAPSTGTFSVGDVATDYSGKIWICTASGTPGTWVNSSTNIVTSVFGRTGNVIGTATDYTGISGFEAFSFQVTGTFNVNNIMTLAFDEGSGGQGIIQSQIIGTAYVETKLNPFGANVSVNLTGINAQSVLDVNGDLSLTAISTPSTPRSNTIKLYPKVDGNLYYKNSSGVESQLSPNYWSLSGTVLSPSTLSNTISIVSDSSSSNPSQISIKGLTNTSQQLIFGFNTSQNGASIQTGNQSGFYPNIYIQGIGGNVAIGFPSSMGAGFNQLLNVNGDCYISRVFYNNVSAPTFQNGGNFLYTKSDNNFYSFNPNSVEINLTSLNKRIITSSGSNLATDDIIFIDTTTGAVTLTIDTTLIQRQLTVVNYTGAGLCQFQAKSGQFLSGSSTAYTITTNWSSRIVTATPSALNSVIVASYGV